MDFKIMSREVCERYSKQKHSKSSAVISIRSSWDRVVPDIEMTDTNKIMDILFVDFCDVDINKYGPNMAITLSDAREIARFIEKHKEDVDVLVAHCDGGISRSAGVIAAAERYLNNDDSKVFRSRTKHPDMCVYLAIIKAFEDEFEWSIQNFLLD